MTRKSMPRCPAGRAAAAQDAGMSYSAWIAQTARKEFVIQAGLEAVSKYEAEHGPFTPDEIAKPMSGPPGSPSRPPPSGPHDRGHLRFRGADPANAASGGCGPATAPCCSAASYRQSPPL